MFHKLKKYRFLFEELVKRDFKKKYKRTALGMVSLLGNAPILTKVNVPKYLFLLSKNVQTLINFSLSLIVFVIFCFIDHITFTWKVVTLICPIGCFMYKKHNTKFLYYV